MYIYINSTTATRDGNGDKANDNDNDDIDNEYEDIDNGSGSTNCANGRRPHRQLPEAASQLPIRTTEALNSTTLA